MVFGWFKKLKSGLSKSSEKLTTKINKVIKGKKIDEATLSELEEILISSDMGVKFSLEVIDDLRKSKMIDPTVIKIKKVIQKKIINLLEPLEKKKTKTTKPYIFLIVGVNGVGKTATVGKIAHNFFTDGKKVGLVAADTFRAAAVDQLKIWSERTKSEFFSAKEKSDPAALAYESVKQTIEKKIDILIIDTAGRLHNKNDLMNELSKIIRVIKKIDEDFPTEIVLVLDGNIGQNSVKQAEVFKELCDIDSIIITKLDGTAKGGVLIPIAQLLNLPISFIGTGEQKEDLINFKAKEYTEALLDLS